MILYAPIKYCVWINNEEGNARFATSTNNFKASNVNRNIVQKYCDKKGKIITVK